MSFTFSVGMPRFSVLFFLMKDQNCLGFVVKRALYRIWFGVNRLGDSGVKVV